MCEHAETYRVQALAAACARVIVLVGADDADWGVIDKAPIVTAALARLAVPKKGREDRPAATQTEDEARAELFAAWLAVNAEMEGLPNATHRAHVAKNLEVLLRKLNKPGVVARKAKLAERVAYWRRRVVHYRRFPQYVIPQADLQVHSSQPSRLYTGNWTPGNWT